MAFARETSGALLAGTTPLVATALYKVADSWWPIAACMVVYATIALVSVHYSKYFRSDARQSSDTDFASEDAWVSAPADGGHTAKAVV